MKRSEMEEIIMTAIDNCCGSDDSGRLYPPDDYLAFVILKAIEDAGMLPPPIKTEIWNRQDNDFYSENE